MQTERTREVDVVVIGAGTAGLAAYRAAAAHTNSVLLVEGGTYGTTCARVGCMPSKLLIAAADAAHHARVAGPFGVHAEVRINGAEVMTRVLRERDRFVGFVVDSVQKIPDAHLLHGNARFVGPGKIEVAGTVVAARAVVIATGSSPVVPAVFDGIRDRMVVNDDVFAWRDLPRSMAVFGAGVIGVELGQAFHRLGVRTRIFGRGGRVGPLTDPQVATAASRALQEELAIDFDAKVRAIRKADDGGVEVSFEGPKGELQVERFETVLVAAGRRPNLAMLEVESAGVDLQAPIDRQTLRWGQSAVFVAGDVVNDRPLLHEAADEGAIAGANAARFPEVSGGHRRSALGIAFCDPQMALAGLTYEEVRARGPVTIGAVSFEDQGRSRVMLQNKGLLRIYADPKSGRFLGAELAGPSAEHLGHLLAWAHQQEMTIDAMLAMPFYHPVVEEGLRTALRDTSAKLKSGEVAGE